jgi:hypothetical protein
VNESPPDDQEWKARLARAEARRALAAADFCVTVAEVADRVPVRTIEDVLGASPDEVQTWITRGRELGPVPAGQLGRGPYEIAQRHAVGDITHEQMIDALRRWRYVPTERMTDLADDIGVLDEGTFRTTVGDALRDRLISAEDYDSILASVSSGRTDQR